MLCRANSLQKSDSMETQYYPEPIRRCENGECSGSRRSWNPDNSCMFGGMEESEVVDELQQILVDCLKKADVTRQEILLRKFFLEIEKEVPLQRFLLQRVKHSKISSLFANNNIIIPAADDDVRLETVTEMNSRDIKVREGEKLEKFKVRTVQVGVVVKEEGRTLNTCSI